PVENTWPNVLLMTITGLGVGMQLPSATVAAQNAVAYRHMGVATGLSSFSRSLGAAIGVALLTATLFAATHSSAPAELSYLSGADMVKVLMGDGAQLIDSALSGQLLTPANDAFTTVFLLVAAI